MYVYSKIQSANSFINMSRRNSRDTRSAQAKVGIPEAIKPQNKKQIESS